jgi:hypothetical protein
MVILVVTTLEGLLLATTNFRLHYRFVKEARPLLLCLQFGPQQPLTVVQWSSYRNHSDTMLNFKF